uniref:Uncharacterized protein n=1 Tax=Gallus gallus TaxID=9031 RepID=A0A8V0YH94_CHICK
MLTLTLKSLRSLPERETEMIITYNVFDGSCPARQPMVSSWPPFTPSPCLSTAQLHRRPLKEEGCPAPTCLCADKGHPKGCRGTSELNHMREIPRDPSF